MRTPVRIAAVLAAGSLGLAGCGFHGVYGADLPGGPDVGDHPYRVTVEFADVLDLVPQSAVRVNDVPVGKVEKIDLDGWNAKVTLLVNGGVDLPANAHAQLRQTSLLGEKFVQLSPPPSDPASGRLADGANIPLLNTTRSYEVEEVFSALSLLLNNGGIAQLQTITHELNAAMSGREDELRAFLSNLDEFTGTLDAQKTQITKALDSIDKLTVTLNKQRTLIGQTLDELPGALKVLSDQRGQLVQMLTSLSKLGTTAGNVINATQADLVDDLKLLQPILANLTAAGSSLPKALDLLLTYPFPAETVNAVKGDYANLYATLDLDLTDVFNNVVLGAIKGQTSPGAGTGAGSGSGSGGNGGIPALPGVDDSDSGGDTGLPGLPLPGTGSGGGSGSGSGSGAGSGSGGSGGAPDLLCGLLGGC